MQVMLDSNAFDRIVASPDIDNQLVLLFNNGRLMLLTTHVQADEIAAIPDQHRRELFQAVTTIEKLTSVAVWDRSRWDKAEFGDDEANAIYERLQGGNPKRSNDAIVGVTALRKADAIVTEDADFRTRLQKEVGQLQIWTFDQFIQELTRL
jgi:hypothetical protein